MSAAAAPSDPASASARARSTSTIVRCRAPKRKDRVGDGRAGPARSEQHDPIRARAGQAALECLLEAAGVRVVADPPAVAQHDRIDRAERRSLG